MPATCNTCGHDVTGIDGQAVQPCGHTDGCTAHVTRRDDPLWQQLTATAAEQPVDRHQQPE